MATVTVRRDGSSRFGNDNHCGQLPSGSLAWRASEEDFIKNLGVFSNLKVRAGYGVTGNERIGDYASYALVSTNHITLDGSSNTPGTHLSQSSPENASLKWETTTQYNVGFDMGFFNNRLSVTLDGYWKKTKDLLLNVLEYHPFLIKPNNHELGELFGVELKTREEVIPYAKKLQEKGAVNVLVSMAGEGAVLIDANEDVYMAPAPKGTLVNGVGAGDSMVAGFMAGWLEKQDYEHAFCMGVSAGSASAFSEHLATKAEIEAV